MEEEARGVWQPAYAESPSVHSSGSKHKRSTSHSRAAGAGAHSQATAAGVQIDSAMLEKER